MNFDLSEEQQFLKDSVERSLARIYDFEKRSAIIKQESGWSRNIWAQLAELGLLGLPFSEEDGGFGNGPVETMIVMEAFGRSLVVEPYLSTVVLAGAVLRHGASASMRASLVAQIAQGDIAIAWAHEEAGSRWNLSHVGTRAVKSNDDFRVIGEKCFVVHGASADLFLVSMRVDGNIDDEGGVVLALIPRSREGVVVENYSTHDGQRAANVSFNNVLVGQDEIICGANKGFSVLSRAVDEAIAAICAEAVGAMDEAVKMTVDYLKTRQQFGVPIGSFQALQHRAADMFIALEQARSMTYFAAMSVSDDDENSRRRAMSAVKVQIAKSSRFIGQQAIQLHGGIGVTMEYKVGHLFKRLTILEKQFGDYNHHLSRLSKSDYLIGDV